MLVSRVRCQQSARKWGPVKTPIRDGYEDVAAKNTIAESRTIHSLLRRAAKTSPDAAALLGVEKLALTYRCLLEQVETTAAWLASKGVRHSDRVALVTPNGPESASLFLSVAAFATCAPLNPAYRSSEFESYLSEIDPKLVIVEDEGQSPVRDVAHSRGIEVVNLRRRADAEAGRFDLGAVIINTKPSFASPEDVALVLHTSGTTLRPKMVPLTHANLCTSAESVALSLALTKQDCCLNVMPLFHIHGLIGALLSSLSVGASVACTPGFKANLFYRWMHEFQPTWYTGVPTMHQAIVAKSADNADTIARHPFRLIRSCSAAMPPKVMADLEQVFGAPVIEAYGMTEASHQMASNPLPPRERKPGSVGLPAGTEIAVMNDSGEMLSQGLEGEIVIRGANVTLGYLNNPDANQHAFSDGWFRTGDQGRLDDDGYLFITGRIKEIIVRGGEKIAPREVDEVLLSHPAVAEALAFALPDAKLGEEVAAVVVLKAGTSVGELELREFVAKRMVYFKVPRKIIFREEIPKGPTGKPQRIGLASTLGLELHPAIFEPSEVCCSPN